MKDVLVYFLLGMAVLGLAVGVMSEFGDGMLCFDNEGSPLVSYMYVQEAASGSITQTEDDAYTLSLAGVSPETLVFTDRPVREAFHIETRDFTAAFGKTFAGDPPNAALAYVSESGEPSTAVFEIHSPTYDQAGTSVLYQAILIPEAGAPPAAGELPVAFGEASLFIDSSGGTSTTPTSAGTTADSSTSSLSDAWVVNVHPPRAGVSLQLIYKGAHDLQQKVASTDESGSAVLFPSVQGGILMVGITVFYNGKMMILGGGYQAPPLPGEGITTDIDISKLL